MSQVNINCDYHKTRADKVIIHSDKDPLTIRGEGIRFNPLPGQSESSGWHIEQSKSPYSNWNMATTANSVIPANKVMMRVFRINNVVFWEFGMITSESTNNFTVGGAGGVGPQWVTGTMPVDFRPEVQIVVPVQIQKNTGESEVKQLIIDEDGSMSINIGNSTLWAAGNLLNIPRCSGHYSTHVNG